MNDLLGGIIERFFDRLTARDWESLGNLFSSHVERIGPFGDRLVGRERYLDFLRGTVPSVYRNDVLRITYAQNGRSGFARVTEHLTYPGLELHLEETYAFDIDEEGLLSRVEIFGQSPESDPDGFGSAKSDESYASRGSADPDATR
jgi:hypothetical protein